MKRKLRHGQNLNLFFSSQQGFEPQIRSIVEKVPKERQTMLFSATWPREIQRLAHDFLTDPIQVNVGEVNALVANKDITQTIYMCEDDTKYDKRKEILQDLKDNAPPPPEDNGRNGRHLGGGGPVHEKVIVFVAKKFSCNDLANRLWDEGFAVDSLHGDRPQWERTKVMQAFKSGVLRILIATDVASRGLDVKDIGTVVVSRKETTVLQKQFFSTLCHVLTNQLACCNRTMTCLLAATVSRTMSTELVEQAVQELRAKPSPFSLVVTRRARLSLWKCCRRQNKRISLMNCWPWRDLDLVDAVEEEVAEDEDTCQVVAAEVVGT